MWTILFVCSLGFSASPTHVQLHVLEKKIQGIEYNATCVRKQLHNLNPNVRKGFFLSKYESLLVEYLKILELRHSLLTHAHLTYQQVLHTEKEIALLSQITRNASTIEIFIYFAEKIRKQARQKKAYLREARHYVLQDYILMTITPCVLIYKAIK